MSFLIIGSLLSAAPIFAHHAFNSEFDASKSIRWVGTVTKIEWMNPHARFYIDVKDANGTVTNWNFEMGSPLQLRRQGLGRRQNGQRQEDYFSRWPRRVWRIAE